VGNGKTRVVHVRREKFDVYVGRAFMEFPESVYGNPFRVRLGHGRKEVIAEYEEYARKRMKEDPVFRRAVLDLRGKVLGCWCKPKACHGDVLAALAEEE
jgi:hypothetical protein